MTLAEFEKNAPIVPEETCPAIDVARQMVGGWADSLVLLAEEIQRNSRSKDAPRWCEELLELDRLAASVALRLEELRTANDQLRRSGAYWHKAARELAP